MPIRYKYADENAASALFLTPALPSCRKLHRNETIAQPKQPGTPMATTVLIVDDDPVQRRLLEAMIRRFGYDPLVASSADEGLNLLAAEDGGHQGGGARSRHARSRRYRHAGAHAREWKRSAGYRADRAWLDRYGRLGHARGRHRFRGQARRRRASRSLAAERPACGRARGRDPAHAPTRFRHPHLQGSGFAQL